MGFLEEEAFDMLLGSGSILMRRGQHGSLGWQGLRQNFRGRGGSEATRAPQNRGSLGRSQGATRQLLLA